MRTVEDLAIEARRARVAEQEAADRQAKTEVMLAGMNRTERRAYLRKVSRGK